MARAASSLGGTVGVIPAGEVWEDGTLRPCIEDLIGAGAVIDALIGDCSPEARLASAAFEHFQTTLGATLRACSSGKELIERGFGMDVELAAELNVSHAVPRLIDGAFLSLR